MLQMLALILNILQEPHQVLFRKLGRGIEKGDGSVCRDARANILVLNLACVRFWSEREREVAGTHTHTHHTQQEIPNLHFRIHLYRLCNLGQPKCEVRRRQLFQHPPRRATQRLHNQTQIPFLKVGQALSQPDVLTAIYIYIYIYRERERERPTEANNGRLSSTILCIWSG
jgi:hypothetical protein